MLREAAEGIARIEIDRRVWKGAGKKHRQNKGWRGQERSRNTVYRECFSTSTVRKRENSYAYRKHSPTFAIPTLIVN